MLELVKGCVKARLNIIISGGTGAGKTTFLNMLSGFIPSNERIVTIEDAAELQLRQTHVARLETRPPNVEGKGAVVQRHLLINALRMRPDRIIVGEVRGEEALDMLQAMNTGHDGSLTTIHANTPRDAIARLEVMIGMASSNLNVRSIRQQVASAIDLFVQISRMSDGTRKVTYITECVGMEGDLVTTQDIFVFERVGVTSEGRVTGRFRPTGVRPKFSERLESGRHRVFNPTFPKRCRSPLIPHDHPRIRLRSYVPYRARLRGFIHSVFQIEAKAADPFHAAGGRGKSYRSAKLRTGPPRACGRFPEQTAEALPFYGAFALDPRAIRH